MEKKQVKMPDELIGIIKCDNHKCITNNEPMLTHFHVLDKENGISGIDGIQLLPAQSLRMYIFSWSGKISKYHGTMQVLRKASTSGAFPVV